MSALFRPDPTESGPGRILALILVVIALGMVLESLGFPMEWPL